MKKIFKNLTQKITHRAMSILPMLAVMVAVSSANTTCFYFLHQPDVPDELKKTGSD
jgi:cyclic lactone autoinducer peptide